MPGEESQGCSGWKVRGAGALTLKEDHWPLQNAEEGPPGVHNLAHACNTSKTLLEQVPERKKVERIGRRQMTFFI